MQSQHIQKSQQRPFMKNNPIKYLIPVFLAIACASCGDDPKLVEKREKQKAEIARLRGEIALVEEKLKNLPPDVSEEVEKARKQSEKQTAEIAKLESEVTELEARKRTLQSEFDVYKSKYQLK
jgi:DNA repair exonuclease SbcCD ATPase subunit